MAMNSPVKYYLDHKAMFLLFHSRLVLSIFNHLKAVSTLLQGYGYNTYG